MKLGKILSGVADGEGNRDLEINGVVSDSRKVQKGFLFVAYKGVDVDGHRFIKEAIENGAVAVVGEEKLDFEVPYFQVNNGRLAWARMMSNRYDNPEKKLKIIGVTGTDGKTTTSSLIYEFLKASGKKVSMVSTIKAVVVEHELDTGLHTSTPDPDILWPWLAEMVKAGQTHVVLETTSQGLAQHRLGGIVFEVGVLTNLAYDHLEFHKTIEAYREAKAMLFEKSKISILNKRSKEYEYFKDKAENVVVSYDVCKEIRNVKYLESKSSFSQKFEMLVDNKWLSMNTFLLGEYNLENILAATKVVLSMGIDIQVTGKVLRKFSNLAGRFQIVPNERGVRFVVDFAHTEQGLESVISMVRKHLRRFDERIIVVFGCNGDRDQTKRAPMGKAASKLADLVVVTAEDPRMESIDQIFSQISEGCEESGGKWGETYFRVDDRRQAIYFAVNKLAKRGDWVLFLGKGHERSMNVGGVETPWDEVLVVKEILNSREKMVRI